MKQYVQYGCGLSAPKDWVNFDSSPTLRLQKTPLIGMLLGSRLNTKFPDNVMYGDVVNGLPVNQNSCDGVYCSHVLEHLSYDDFKTALNNSYLILKPGGLFRLVMPDFMCLVNSFLLDKKAGDSQASVRFMKNSGMALEQREKGFKAALTSVMGNSRHQWLWDHEATVHELEQVGFKDIRPCVYNDSEDSMFNLVEDSARFNNAIALEMRK